MPYFRAVLTEASREGIAKNIAILASNNEQSKRATQRLIIVGAAALPQSHQTLTESSTPDEQRFKIMSVLGEIGSAGSIGPLIASAGMRDSGGMYRPALFALALPPPTDEAVACTRALLANGVNQRRQSAGATANFNVELGKVRDHRRVVQFFKETLVIRQRHALRID